MTPAEMRAEFLRLKALADAAAQGPWTENPADDEDHEWVVDCDSGSICSVEFVERAYGTAVFIAAAHDMMALLEAQAARIAELDRYIEGLHPVALPEPPK